MRHLLLIAALLPTLATAEIYRWTDEQGRVHFSERPVAGAETVKVKPQVVERDAQTRGSTPLARTLSSKLIPS